MSFSIYNDKTSSSRYVRLVVLILILMLELVTKSFLNANKKYKLFKALWARLLRFFWDWKKISCDLLPDERVLICILDANTFFTITISITPIIGWFF